jgi:flagellar motor switch protein fliN
MKKMANDMLSQEEINALLSGVVNNDTSDVQDVEKNDDIIDAFTDMEKDAIGEIGNISMGSAATTLFTLLSQRVEITTPTVKQTTIAKIAENYPLPFVSVFIKYSVGIDGMNLLILKEDDVKIITSLMLGGDGVSDLPEDLTEMHLSAISEAMNQMMGAASTSLSEMLGGKIDITPPKVSRVNFKGDRLDPDILDPTQEIMCTSFRMRVGNLIDSEIMQILPIEFARKLIDKIMGGAGMSEEEEQVTQEQAPQAAQAVQEVPQATPVMPPQEQYQAAPQQYYQAPPPQYYQAPPQMQYEQMPPQPSVRVQQAQFSSFDSLATTNIQVPENMDLIKDVMLQITVELGKTVKPINEILDFKPGSVLELDKVVGESLDILANGKKIATGEVVVIDENYGIRITDIVKPDKRLQSL